MQAAYGILSLPAERIVETYPLIREQLPDLTLDQWSVYVRALVGESVPSEGGIIACERKGRIRGLFAWQSAPDPSHRKIMRVHHFTVLEVVHRNAATQSLITAMHRQAEAMGCGAVRVELPTGSFALTDFTACGHEVEIIGLCRPLPAARS